ncbi:MAG: hypothetical protein AAB116_21780 [Candidatus Poribacteria bacterium]
MKKVINIEEYDKPIRKIAAKLSCGDKFLAEELISEMYITILSSEDGKSMSLYLREAKFRAIDYMRSKDRNYTYEGAFQHISLEAMEEAGIQIDTEERVYEPENQNSVLVFDGMPDNDYDG